VRRPACPIQRERAPEGWVGARCPFIAAPPNQDLENALLNKDLFNNVLKLLIFCLASRCRPFSDNRKPLDQLASNRKSMSNKLQSSASGMHQRPSLRSGVRSIDTSAQSGCNPFSSGRNGSPCRGSCTSHIACCSGIHGGQSKCPKVRELRREYPARRRCEYRAKNQCSGRI
jgi:hypothetical protein